MLVEVDKMFRNGKIYTMVDEKDIADSFCVKNGRIVKVGTQASMKGIEAREEIDLDGKVVLPGFIDCHQHALEYANTKQEVDLREANSKQELLELLQKRVKQTPDGQWIKGSGFDHEKFPDKSLPTAAELDQITTKHPIIISRYCVHYHVANSLAMRLAGIQNRESGLLKETEVKPVMCLVPPMLPTIDMKKNALQKTIASMNECGITGIHVIGASISNVSEYLNVYQEMEEEKRLHVRIYFCPDEYPVFGMKTGFGNSKIRYGFYKIFVDGSLGPRTAALSEPYSDDPANLGIMTNTAEEVKQKCKKAYDMGLQIGIHAIGDRGIEAAVDAMEACYLENPKKDPRFRLIHGMCMRQDLIERIKKLPIIVDIQPGFTSNNNIWWSENRLGKQRIKYAYAWKTLIQNGIMLTGSSDSPVENFSPLLGVYSVVCRQDRTGMPKEGWMPQERVSVFEAISMYTKNAAYASYEEKDKGTIEEGKLADFVVLKENPFTIDPAKIKDITVLETFLDGKSVYRKEE